VWSLMWFLLVMVSIRTGSSWLARLESLKKEDSNSSRLYTVDTGYSQIGIYRKAVKKTKQAICPEQSIMILKMRLWVLALAPSFTIL